MKQALRFTLLCITVFGLVEVGTCQTTLRYAFDDESDLKGWTQFQLGKKKAGWKMEAGGINGSKCIVNHAPTGDADKDSLIDWYVSPELDLSQGGIMDSIKYNYFTYFGTFFKEQSVTISLLVGDQDPTKAKEVIELADLSKNYTAVANEWSDTGNISLPSKTDACYIGFTFIAVDGWSSISFDDLQITLNKTVSVPNLAKPTIAVYPNPNIGQVFFKGITEGDNLEFRVYSLTGENLGTFEINSSQPIQLDLPQGAYVYKIVGDRRNVNSVGKLQVVAN
jgi:hypothetical protein